MGSGLGVLVQQVEQLHAPLDGLQCVAATGGDEPGGRHVQVFEPVVSGDDPQVEPVCVQAGIHCAPVQQQIEDITQAVGGDARVHQDRADIFVAHEIGRASCRDRVL